MIKKILIFLIIVCLIIYFGRNQIIKGILEFGIKKALNLKVNIKELEFSLLKNSLLLKEVYVLNPENYPEKEMAYIPKIFIEAKLISIFKKEVQIRNLILNILRINVIKNKNSQLNVASFKESRKRERAGYQGKIKKKGKERKKIKIANLRLKIGKLIYKDFSSKPYKVKQFYLNIDKQYKNIEDLNAFKNQLLTELVLEYLRKNLNIRIMKGINQKTNQINQSLKDLIEGVKDKISDLFDKVK